MKKPTQKDIVLKLLRQNGSISRNECLRMFISRLSSIMLILKNEGVNFETKNVDGDYVYNLLSKPKETIVYTLQDGSKIIKIIWPDR